MIHFPKKDFLKKNFGDVPLVPLLSFACGLLILLTLVWPAGGSLSDTLLWAALGSCGILLLRSPGKEGRGPGVALALWELISTLSLVLLSGRGLLGPRDCTGYICAVTAFAPAMLSLTRVIRLSNDLDYLVAQISGWELLVESTRMAYTLLFLFMSAAAAQAFSSPVAAFPAVRWAGALTLLLLYLILLVRGIVDAHEAVSGSRKTKLRKLVRDNIVIVPVNPDRISLNHRMMYTRMCEFMETSRPFLNEDFSLDDMARAMYSNRSYLSKMINSCTHMNFNQFVNNYRVRYSMELYKKDRRLKVVELAELCGFRNNVSYTMAFKFFLGVPPGEWCRSYDESVKGAVRPSSSLAEGR